MLVSSLCLLALVTFSHATEIEVSIGLDDVPAFDIVAPPPPTLPVHFTLNNGKLMPRIGFGTAGLGDGSKAAIVEAIRQGYQLVDSAQATEWYREDALGEALREWYGLTGDYGDHIFLVTKIHPKNFGINKTYDAVEKSLRTLGRIDLMLIHSPVCWSGSCPEKIGTWQETWRMMEVMYKAGTLRSIGVSNFGIAELGELFSMSATKPQVVQNWMDPLHQDKEVRAYCKEHDIVYVAYSQFGNQWGGGSSNPVMTDPTLIQIAEKHSRPVSSVILSWALQSGVGVIPRSSNFARMAENIALQDLANNVIRPFLDQSDMEAIEALDRD